MNKAAIPLVIFLVMAGLFLFVLQKINKGEYDPKDIPTELIGQSVPDFNLANLLDADDRVMAADYKGKPWLLNVWGTWCAECWREHGYLVQLKNQGIPIVGINWRDDEAEARAFLRDQGNPFVEVGFEPKSDAVIDLGVYGAPETFLVDANGMITVKHKGAMHPKVWQEKFQAAFN